MHEHMDAATAERLHAARTVGGRPPEEPLGFAGTIGVLLDERAGAEPEREWLVFYDEADARTAYTFHQFQRTVHQTARFLADTLGLRPGDRIASVAHNHADTAVLYFAAWALGLTVVPVNVGEDDERVAFIVNNAESKVLFVRPEYLGRVAALRPDFATVREIVQVGGAGLHAGADRHLDAERPTDGASFTPPQPFSQEQEALIVYTSGTTGAPKGVLLSQYNLLVDAWGIREWHGIHAAQRMMCVLPLHHVNGIVVTLVTPLLAGAATVLNRAFSPRWFWGRVEQECVGIVSVVPTLLAFLLEAERTRGGFAAHDLTAFRHFICGAGPLTVQLATEFEATFGQRIIHGYGLSETTCYSCFLPLEHDDSEHHRWLHDFGYPSIGVPIAPNEMAIHDEAGQPLPPGPEHKGEIVVRGHNVMQGYFRRPDANASTFAHGWFRSGDEGFMVPDEQGRPFFFITGRLKELIIRGGVNYSTYEIDEVLMALPGVRAGLAVGFPNKFYGEEVGAYIVLEAGVEQSAEEILHAARQHLPFSKSPKVVVFGTEVPVTSTGKYQRLRLAPLFAEHEGSQFRE